MYVIGTAGHVDHGKSTLIQALTGIDPDRLQEEKNRGMTIDLGFAWLELPSGKEVSIVDVPGHERFIKNMLAGIGGIDLALLVVAADEGVMPQTREHLAIIDLLGINECIVVITKTDLVEKDFVDLVQEEVREEISKTNLSQSNMIAVSAFTGENLEELKQFIDKSLLHRPERKNLDRPRLPIDRSFSITGFGTVVTGTLIDGELSIGQELEVIPGRKKVRVRGLESHKQKKDKITAGTRAAVNLSGINASDLSRGQVLTIPGWLRPTRTADAKIKMIDNAPGAIKHNLEISFHWMAAESMARIRLLDSNILEDGEEGWVQIILDNPLPLVKGDFFVIRTSQGTLCGGKIVETSVKRHKRNDTHLIERLESLHGNDSKEVILKTIESKDALSPLEISHSTSIPEDQVRSILFSLTTSENIITLNFGKNEIIYSSQNWKQIKDSCLEYISTHHADRPLSQGPSKEEIRSKLRINSDIFLEIVNQLEKEAILIQDGPILRLPNHVPTLSLIQEKIVRDYISTLKAQPNNPPTDNPIEEELLSYIVEKGLVIKVNTGIIYESQAYSKQIEIIVEYIKTNGSITVGETRDLLTASRKYVLPLLESMDQNHLTRRSNDNRFLY